MPHTSSSGSNKNLIKKKKKSKEFINETESSNSEKELNILSRPKRNIILNMDGLIAAQTILNDTDSDEDDEDFKIDFKSDDDDDESDGDNSNSGISSSRSSSGSNDENDEVKLKIEQNKKKPKKTIEKKATSQQQLSKTSTTKIKKGTKIRKNKIKKLIEMKKNESNQEIEKIFSKFKNVNTKNAKNLATTTTTNANKLIQKEKLPAIIDPLNLNDWICSLCHNKPNAFDFLGPLFGPYRINITGENDYSLSDENKSDFKEVWLHENCAIWNSSIFVKDNRVFGIAKCLKSSSDMKCISCKKTGATLTCNRLDCTRNYHYPCAVQNNCNLETETLNLQCKIHST